MNRQEAIGRLWALIEQYGDAMITPVGTADLRTLLTVDDGDVLERVARVLCARHYAARFAKEPDDPHVQMNVDGNWPHFAEDARAAIEAVGVGL